jgi:hypothetical protein
MFGSEHSVASVSAELVLAVRGVSLLLCTEPLEPDHRTVIISACGDRVKRETCHDGPPYDSVHLSFFMNFAPVEL